MLHLYVGQRGHAPRTPVRDAVPAIDQAFVVQAHEHFAHRAREILIHGEPLARPVDGIAETTHLSRDPVAVLHLPLPHAAHEILTPEIVAGLTVFRELALHDVLGCDA